MTFGVKPKYQLQVPLGGLPVNLVLVGNKEDGKVVFVVVGGPTGIYDTGEVQALFEQRGFTLFFENDVQEFDYNIIYSYKEIPLMLRWLQQQNLQHPGG